MAAANLSDFFHRLTRGMAAKTLSDHSDRQLVEMALAGRDEAAFQVIMHRHGPMVYRVCWRVLQHPQDAEDAFQATFLVLAQKLRTVRKHASLASWLHGVARSVALKARAQSAARRHREQRASLPDPLPPDEVTWGELRSALDFELSRLPDKWRLPLVLCYLEGRTQDEAASQLAWSKSTLRRRLEEGRDALGSRLNGRGIVWQAGFSAVLLADCIASAAPAPGLVVSTVEAAAGVAAGKTVATAASAKVAALTEGVLKAMLITKLKMMTAVLAGMAVTMFLAAPGMLTFAQQDAGKSAQTPAAPPPPNKPEGKKEKAGWREAFVLKHEHSVNIVSCSADWIAAGDEGGNLFLYNAKTGKNRTLHAKGGKGEGLTSSVDRLQFTPDGKHLFAVTSERRAITRLDLDPKSDKLFRGLRSENPTYFGVSADGETWLEFYGRTLVLRPNGWTNDPIPPFYESVKYEAKIAHAVTSDDDKWLAVATDDEQLRILDRASLKETQTIPLAKQTVNAVQFSKDGKRLAAVGSNGFAKVYDPENGKEVATLKGHDGIIFCVAFSPDGKTVVTGGDDHVARVWNAATGNPLAIIEGHKDSVRSVAFDPSGEMLLTGSADKTVKTWRLTK